MCVLIDDDTTPFDLRMSLLNTHVPSHATKFIFTYLYLNVVGPVRLSTEVLDTHGAPFV